MMVPRNRKQKMGNGKEQGPLLPEALMRLQDIDHVGYFNLILTVSQALQKMFLISTFSIIFEL